jgi:hypothetical protein
VIRPSPREQRVRARTHRYAVPHLTETGQLLGEDRLTPFRRPAIDGIFVMVVVVVNSNYTHDEPVSGAMREVLTTAYCAH